MKTTLMALLMLFTAVFNAQAQEAATTQKSPSEKQKRAEELMSIKIDMEVDKDLFMQVTPNTYVSETPMATIMAMVIPDTYEKAKADLESNMSQGFKVSDKGEKMMNGVKVVYIEGTTQAQGNNVNNFIYCIKRDEETCILFVGMLEEGATQIYKDTIQAALNSVVKKH